MGFEQTVSGVATYRPGQSVTEAGSVGDVKFEMLFR